MGKDKKLFDFTHPIPNIMKFDIKHILHCILNYAMCSVGIRITISIILNLICSLLLVYERIRIFGTYLLLFCANSRAKWETCEERKKKRRMLV